MSSFIHQPVLLEESLSFFQIKENALYVDATTGEGGHSLRLLEKIPPSSTLLCLDQDAEIQALAKQRLAHSSNTVFKLSNFRFLKNCIQTPVCGILFDLGLSTYHYKKSNLGFSFLENKPLNMAFDGAKVSAFEIINHWEQEEIAKIFSTYGEEKYATRIARSIVYYRENISCISNTKELATLVEKVLEKVPYAKNKHKATKVFQALRIQINDEMNTLESVLCDLYDILEKGGRAVFLTYHSLESHKIEDFLSTMKKAKKFKSLLKHPILPSKEEIEKNRSARSAKLYVFEKIAKG